MLDPNLLRYQLEIIVKKLSRRNFQLDSKKIQFMEQQRKDLQVETEKLQNIHNCLSKSIGDAKKLNKDYIKLYKQVIKISKKLLVSKNKLTKLKKKIRDLFLEIPNLPDDSIPDGLNKSQNKEITRWGKIPEYDFPIKDHVELGNNLKGFDWNSSVSISGSRFSVIKNNLARLHRALGQFMLDLHTEKHGYLEMYVPYLVNQNSLYGTGQLPKFSDDLFHIKNLNQNDSIKYTLIPTAEVPLTNIVNNKIIKISELPIKLTTQTPCFRMETSSYGKDTRGLIRMHQFEKVELVQIVEPKNSMYALEELTLHAEKVLQLLQLPYRKVLLCAGDLGFSSSKTYDLEVWFPSQNTYREVSSCSNMLDFQTRRMKSRYKPINYHKKNLLLHTVNGSGLAIGRTLAAILENNQCADGKIFIPLVLQKKYMNGLTHLIKNKF